MASFNNLDYEILTPPRDGLPQTIASSTRRVYDVVSGVYPLSTYCFHSRAHRVALEMSGIRNGMRVLEVATGSGEMFRRLVKANRAGQTFGLDLSPKMAAKTLRRVQREFPSARAHCQAVDARHLPFRDESFNALICCYLLELLATDDIYMTLAEFHRVLKPGGTLTIVLIGQDVAFFNGLYRVANSVAPAFWGRQVDDRVPDMVASSRFRVIEERQVRQAGYPSRVLAAAK